MICSNELKWFNLPDWAVLVFLNKSCSSPRLSVIDQKTKRWVAKTKRRRWFIFCEKTSKSLGIVALMKKAFYGGTCGTVFCCQPKTRRWQFYWSFLIGGIIIHKKRHRNGIFRSCDTSMKCVWSEIRTRKNWERGSVNAIVSFLAQKETKNIDYVKSGKKLALVLSLMPLADCNLWTKDYVFRLSFGVEALKKKINKIFTCICIHWTPEDEQNHFVGHSSTSND